MSPLNFSISDINPDAWSEVLHEWFIEDANQKNREKHFPDRVRTICICIREVGDEKFWAIEFSDSEIQANVSITKLSIDQCIQITLELTPQYNKIIQCEQTLKAVRHMLKSCTIPQRHKIVTITYHLYDRITDLKLEGQPPDGSDRQDSPKLKITEPSLHT